MKTHCNARRYSDGDFRRILRGDTDLNWYNGQIQSARAYAKMESRRREKEQLRRERYIFSTL